MTAPSRWTTSRLVVVGFGQSSQAIAALRWAASNCAGQDALLRYCLSHAHCPVVAVPAHPVALAESS